MEADLLRFKMILSHLSQRRSRREYTLARLLSPRGNSQQLVVRYGPANEDEDFVLVSRQLGRTP